MPHVYIDDGEYEELKSLAIEMGLVFGTPNDVLRKLLKWYQQSEVHNLSNSVAALSSLERQDRGILGIRSVEPAIDLPHSEVPRVQELIDGVLPTIFNLSEHGFQHYPGPGSGKWVTVPNNFAAILVHDRRGSHITVIIYGGPEDFTELVSSIVVLPDRRSYSRFKVEDQTQVEEALKVIRKAYHLTITRRR